MLRHVTILVYPVEYSLMAASSFKFRKNTDIGAAAAEDDSYLLDTFVDTGNLGDLQNTTNPKAIIVGRTGSGKTALLRYLKYKREERTIEIEPENMSMNYIISNDILNYLQKSGIEIDVFYNWLWKHVIVTEVLRVALQEKGIDNMNFLLEKFQQFFLQDAWKEKKKIENYVESWGDTFFETTEVRIREYVQETQRTISSNIAASGSVPTSNTQASANVDASKNTTLGQQYKEEKRGSEIVNTHLIRGLTEVIKILDKSFLDDSQKNYYVIIDKLDEQWIYNEKVRYSLIVSLLEASSYINSKIENIKVIVSLREDLFDRAFRNINRSGYQPEKYDARKIKLFWQREELLSIVNKRMNTLMKSSYTKEDVDINLLFPKTHKLYADKEPFDYLLERTMMRPRDIILFVSECLKEANGNTRIKIQNLKDAEESYSEQRLDALRHEWAADYPELPHLCRCMRGFPSSFQIQDIQDDFGEKITEFLIDFAFTTTENIKSYLEMSKHYDRQDDFSVFKEFAKIMYRIGTLGIKYNKGFKSIQWSYEKVNIKDINEESVFHVHPSMWHALEIRKVET